MIQGRTGISSASPEKTETIVRKRYPYQVTVMFVTDASTNEKHKFYKSTVQAISIGGGYCATKVGAMCARFVDMVAAVKTQV